MMRAWIRRHRFVLLAAAAVSLAALVVFLPIVSFVVGQEVDYGYHLYYITQLVNGQPAAEFIARVPHFGYHAGVVLVYELLPHLSLEGAAVIVSLGHYVLEGLAALLVLALLAGEPKSLAAALLYTAATLSLLLVMPINLLTPDNLILGYIPANVYYNPTMLTLKPYAVLLFLCAALAFQPVLRRRVPLPLVGVITVGCILAKPSYIIALLPALAAETVCVRWRRWPVDWRTLVWGIGLPAGVMLTIQFGLFRGTGFYFAPLAMLNEVGARINPAAPQNLGLKFALSILFPAAVYLFNWRRALRCPALNLAWLTFFVGAAYMYLLAEGGERLGHANFRWSAQSAVFVLFIVSTGFFIERSRYLLNERRLLSLPVCAFVAGAVIFGLHVVSGLNWYTIHVNAVWMGDIIANLW